MTKLAHVMELTALALFVTFSLTSTLLPGANLILVLKSGLSGGRLASDSAILGVCLGHMAWGGLAVAGVATLMQAAPTLFLALKLLGAGYVFYLGVGLLRGTESDVASSPDSDAPTADRAGLPLLQGLMTALLNPNTGLFFIALFPQFLAERADSAWLGMALVAMHVGIAAGWFSVVGRLASRGGDHVASAQRTRFMQLAGLMLMAFGYLFAWNA